jgi:thioredoxin reductase
MAADRFSIGYDVAIVGGGPAGLSAAVVLGRARRSVVLFDHGRPRNYASRGVHCFLTQDGIDPYELRDRGRREAKLYGVEIVNCEVVKAKQFACDEHSPGLFEICTSDRAVKVRAVLLTTGVTDCVPEIAGVRELYGKSVHHCPYCDGWEHRDQRLAAFGNGSAAVKLALTLRTWSQQVTACSHGAALSQIDRQILARNQINWREEKINRLVSKEGKLAEIAFESGPPLACDALFFSADQCQQSNLPEMLGCCVDEDNCVQTTDKQGTKIHGLFLAGDADGEVQFAIVAAAEGAIAATAINTMLQEQDTA